MSDEAEKAWQVYSREQFFTDQYLKAAFKAGVESQQQRIRELEAERNSYKGLWERLDLASQKHYENLIQDRLDAEDSLREQLAARDAVIERVRSARNNWDKHGGLVEYIDFVNDALDAAPEPVLAEHDARVLEEAANAYEALPEDSRTYFPKIHGRWLRERAALERAAEYRKGAGQ